MRRQTAAVAYCSITVPAMFYLLQRCGYIIILVQVTRMCCLISSLASHSLMDAYSLPP